MKKHTYKNNLFIFLTAIILCLAGCQYDDAIVIHPKTSIDRTAIESIIQTVCTAHGYTLLKENKTSSKQLQYGKQASSGLSAFSLNFIIDQIGENAFRVELYLTSGHIGDMTLLKNISFDIETMVAEGKF